MTTRAKELFEASVDQVRRGQLRPALGTLLDALVADPGHEASLEAAGRICRMLGAADDAVLFEAVHEDSRDPGALYELGYRLVDQTRPELAIRFFERALDGRPEPGLADRLRRELAFAQFSARDFTECLRTLGAVEAQVELAEAERLDLRLLQAESALYLGRRDLARHFLEQADEIVPDDGQRARVDALHGLLARSDRWPDLDEAGLREWHFIQHAGVLLKTAGGFFEDGSRAGRFDMLDLRLDMVAFLCQRLLHLLERLALPVELVVPTSPVAAPLATALARRLGADTAEDLADRRGRPTLLVAAGAGELEPLAPGLSRNRPDLLVFAVNLDWDRDNAVLPEVVGVLSRRAFLPWERRYGVDPDTHAMHEVPGDERPAAQIADELVAAMDALPDDGGKARREFEDFYVPLADDLVLGNETRHPHRRQFTRLSPCWTPVGSLATVGGDADESGDAD